MARSGKGGDAGFSAEESAEISAAVNAAVTKALAGGEGDSPETTTVRHTNPGQPDDVMTTTTSRFTVIRRAGAATTEHTGAIAWIVALLVIVPVFMLRDWPAPVYAIAGVLGSVAWFVWGPAKGALRWWTPIMAILFEIAVFGWQNVQHNGYFLG